MRELTVELIKEIIKSLIRIKKGKLGIEIAIT